MATWGTDVRDILPFQDADPKTPASRRAELTRELVEAATSRGVKGSWCSAVRIQRGERTSSM